MEQRPLGRQETSAFASTNDTPDLRVLGTSPVDCEVDIILLPGIGTPPVESWPFCSPSWVQEYLPLKAKHARLLTFDYTFPLDDAFSWESVWYQGDRFLRALSHFRRSDGSEANARPILFVSHSLGGIILKQALCIANEQLHRYEVLINVVSGIVFLSTPHFKPSHGDKGLTILQLATKAKIKIPPERSEEENSILCDLSVRFEAIRLRAPILSVFEGRESKVPEGRFKHKRMTIVDKDTCTLHAPFEQFLSISLDHVGICHFDKSDDASVQNEVVDFVTVALQGAEDTIASRMEALEYRYATTTAYSPTHSNHSLDEAEWEERARKDSSSTPLDTLGATHGSGTHHSSSQGFELIPEDPSLGQIDTSGPEPQLPCIMLDNQTPNPNFFDREDVLQQISEALLPSTSKFISFESEGLRRFAICGLGGMGKTEIANQFASRNKDAFDAILWIRADEVAKLDARFSEIAIRLGLESPLESKNHIVSRELVKGWLSKPWKRVLLEGKIRAVEEAKWLLIFDNADDPYILMDYWPIQGSGSVLITSRDPLAKSLFATMPSGLDLEPMSYEDGGTFLKKLTNDEDKEGVSDQVARVLGGLPLAIVQMAGVIRRQEMRLSEFMETYNDPSEHSTLHELNFPVSHDAYPHTISTVWALDTLAPGTKNVLYILAILDPDCIQEYILTKPAAQSVDWFPSSPSAFRSARTELLQMSLIKRNKDTEELAVHRLVQDMVRAKMSPIITKEAFWGVVDLLWAQWPTAFTPATRQDAPVKAPMLHFVVRWPKCAALYPHVLKLKNLYERKDKSVLGEPSLSFAALLNDAAWYQFERGKTRGFNDFWTIATQICEKSSDEGKYSLLVDINFCLGAIASETNSHDLGRKHKARALKLQLATPGAQDVLDVRLARCYSEDGVAKIQDGEYDAGIQQILTRINIDKKLGVYPYNWVDEANLGLALILQGKLEEAEEVLGPTLERREVMFGYMDNKDFRLGRILHAVGNLREAQGREDEAFDLHQRSLASFMATVGKNHHRTADLCHKVAQHLTRQERYEEALDKIDQALAIWEYDANVYKPEIARTSHLKAWLLSELGKEIKARVSLRQAYTLRRELVLPGGKADTELDDEDFDALVTFWAK